MAVCPLCDHTGDLGVACPTHPARHLVDEVQLETYRNKEASLLLGRLVSDRFAIVRVLGKGGMGWVYEAVQQPIGRRVALKVLRADHADDDIVRSRFFREARVLGMLQHPNLVTLYDYGVVELGVDDAANEAEAELISEAGGELLFIAMELLRGQTLTDVLVRPRFFNGARLLNVARGVAQGLAEAHRNGIVHRDLKPENVLLVRDGGGQEVVKLVDFGIARLSTANTVLTQTGMVFGTPTYMSPEQAAGNAEIEPPADVYAFGVLLFRMIVGKLPFDSDKPLPLLMMHINKPPPPVEPRDGLEIPDTLRELTEHCLAKTPAERPADGDALVERLEAIEPDSDDAGDQPPAPVESEAPTRASEAVSTDQPTIVLGGDVELVDSATDVDPAPAPVDTTPDGPPVDDVPGEAFDANETVPDGGLPRGADVVRPGEQRPEEVETIVSGPPQTGSGSGLVDAKKAYRVEPRSEGPSALREADTASSRTWIYVVVAGLLLVGGAGLVLALGGEETQAESTGADDTDAAVEEPLGEESVGRAPSGAAPSGTSEGAAPEGYDPSIDVLLEKLATLREQRDTALQTAIDDDHRAEIEASYEEQMAPILDALEEKGIEVPE